MAGSRISVPDLVGFGWEEAREMARAAGLNPRAVGPDGQTVNGKGGVVIAQDPAPGNAVSKRADLALRLAFGGGPSRDSEPRDPLPDPKEFTEWLDSLPGPDVPDTGPFHRDDELAGVGR